jgi:hypothetical protein
VSNKSHTMVQSNYTVSTVQQLLGSMPPVRISGSKSRSTTSRTTTDRHLKVIDKSNSSPAPTRPLPPIPQPELHMRASRSSEVLPFADRMNLRSDPNVPAAIAEDEVLVEPRTGDTPTTTKDQGDLTPVQLGSSMFVPLIEPPRKGKKPATVERRISQYYEYITPPISLGLGRTSSRRDRKASHTPTSSRGSDIYFSPIEANRSQVFLSSPQPSPPDSPTDMLNGHTLRDGRVGEVAQKVATLVVETAPVKKPEMAEITGIGRLLDNRKITLTLSHVDRITTALALAPLVQKSVRGTYSDNETTKASEEPAETSIPAKTEPTALPTPPPSETSFTEYISTVQEFGGVALIDTNVEGAPVSLASTDAFDTGKCTHLSLPSGLSASSTLRVERPSFAGAESKIILRSLFITLDRKTSERALTLVAETHVTTSFARAALTELAHTLQLTLDDLEIQTPTAGGTTWSPDESIDWCRLGDGEETGLIINSPVTDMLEESMATFSSLSAEECAMQTLSLMSELARLQKAHATFLILQPTRYDSNGSLAGVKIPFISEALRKRFLLMSKGKPSVSASAGSPTASIASSASTSTRGGARGRQFREAVIATVAPCFVHEEEFEKFVVLEGGDIRVRARCVPLSDGRKIEKWVCFLGGEYDVPY